MKIRVALTLALLLAGATLNVSAKVTRGAQTGPKLLDRYRKLERSGDLKTLPKWQQLEYRALMGETLTNAEQDILDAGHKENGQSLLRFNAEMNLGERTLTVPTKEEAAQDIAQDINRKQAEEFEDALTLRADAINEVTGASVAHLIGPGLEACMTALKSGTGPDEIKDTIIEDYYQQMITAAQGNQSDEEFNKTRGLITAKVAQLLNEDASVDQKATLEELRLALDGIESALEAKDLSDEERAALEKTRDAYRSAIETANKSMSWSEWAAAKSKIALSIATSRKTLAVVGIAIVGGVAAYYGADVLLPYAQTALDAVQNAGTCALGAAKGAAAYVYGHCLSSAATAATIFGNFWNRGKVALGMK